ncbi:phage tail spike protein [Gleimia hominis]|uniref:Phage tail spike protein n=1 Tax=Gleimia hominis TaxID=595468 RepID=A0ABU3IDX2_9ACTO|nr:phage tail spike protein [Gleimia hominis]MDT3768156.1 phage tail spike protein [Gleimia hominis]
MITVHDRTATSFTATGLGVLDREIINPVVVEELGGEFSLNFTYPADGPVANHLTLENIVACPVPELQLRQGFRISEVVTTLDGLLEVTAFHVFYDLAANLIADTYVVNKTAKAALTQILSAANTSHGFTATSSDNVTRASARVVRMPIAAALMDTGEENTFVSRWGGEITRDNWHIHHTPRRGKDRGVVIRDRKNLTGFESTLDFTSVVTRILPVGFDGLLLPELYVDSPRLGDYVVPRMRVIRYGQVKAISDKGNPREGELPLDQAYGELRRLAAAEFSVRHVDEPSGSYKVRFVDLAATKEYADLARLETVEIGDTVTVRHTDLGIVLSARVVAYEYNPLTRQYNSVELGTVDRKFTSVTRQVKTAINTAVSASDAAGFALASADGKNTNFYGPTQPAQARLGDTWFKQNGETTEIWIYQQTDTGQPSWVALTTDLNHAQITAELDVARREVEQANTAALDAKTVGEQADKQAEIAQAQSQQAKTEATAATAKVSVLDSRLGTEVLRLETAISLKAAKDGIISLINISPEGVLIDGARVHITGRTSIDNAIISTAMIKDAAITSAKITSLSAGKITSGYLSAARIAAGSITSDKLTIRDGFIDTAMIANAAVTSAKIASLDAGKITTGYLNAGRIASHSITADKLAANAIQVGLAGWTDSIRISPSQIRWYNEDKLDGTISSSGMKFWYGDRYIGEFARRGKKNSDDVQGIVGQLAYRGDYVAWTYQNTDGGDYYTCLTLDPKGRFYNKAGIHLGSDLRTNGYKFYTTGSRYVTLDDVTLEGRGTHPGWVGPSRLAKIVFHTYDVMIVTNGSYYNMTRLFNRVSDLMSRVNELIRRLNYGWITSISGSGSNITWSNFSNTGLNAMNTNLT